MVGRDYARTVDLSGSPDAALAFIVSNLTQLGFRLDRKDAKSAALLGPGMRSTRQSALRGISRLSVEVAGRGLNVRADFGGTRWMLRFMIILIAGLALLMLLISLLFLRNHPQFRWWVPVLPFLPWPFLIPFLYGWIRRNTRNALDTLLHNADMNSR